MQENFKVLITLCFKFLVLYLFSIKKERNVQPGLSVLTLELSSILSYFLRVWLDVKNVRVHPEGSEEQNRARNSHAVGLTPNCLQVRKKNYPSHCSYSQYRVERRTAILCHSVVLKFRQQGTYNPEMIQHFNYIKNLDYGLAQTSSLKAPLPDPSNSQTEILF